jgi:hypothetical protein
MHNSREDKKRQRTSLSQRNWALVIPVSTGRAASQATRCSEAKGGGAPRVRKRGGACAQAQARGRRQQQKQANELLE